MLPLSLAKEGEDIMVVRVSGSEEVKKHLSDLGFIPGEKVQVISATGGGNLIVKLKESRLALTEKMAEKIAVTMNKSREV